MGEVSQSSQSSYGNCTSDRLLGPMSLYASELTGTVDRVSRHFRLSIVVDPSYVA